MFPGPNAEIYYNEAGEVMGWDYPSFDAPWDDPYDEADAQWRDEVDDD